MIERHAASRTPRPSKGFNLAQLIPRHLAEAYDVAPMEVRDGTVTFASAAQSPALARDLELSTGLTVQLRAESSERLVARRQELYGEPPAMAHTRVSWVDPAGDSTPTSPMQRGGAAELLDRLLAGAVDRRASDMHLDPHGGSLKVRYRVDGSLRDMETVPGSQVPFVLSRLKVLAGLDIADRVRPQDGRAAVIIDGRNLDLRVSTLPLGAGVEKAVIRILDSAGAVRLEALGLLAGERHQVEKLLAQPEGLILVTGPTGSGKTTTLYSMLLATQSRERNVVTVEDPIEYRLEGVNQVQVNDRAGLTFAAALRSILRQDPDVVLVGEIRDGETAGIAVKASMTGHLVLSTLHTNDAASAVARMLDVGADAGALAGALRGIVAQRLVRRLCPECARPQRLDELPLAQQELLSGMKTDRLRTAVGCHHCDGTGYRGRTVVAEVMLITEPLRRAIARGAEPDELQDLARSAGARALWDAGLQRVLEGSVSLHELLDNIAAPMTSAVMPEDASQSSVDALLAQLRGEVVPAAEPSAPKAIARVTSADRPLRRAIVADDDRAKRRIVRELLEEQGYSVVEAHDGEAALNYAQRLRPTLVVAEIALPRLDAIGLIQALDAMSDSPRVVVCTDQRDEGMHDWLRELGADVVSTPTDIAIVLAVTQAPRLVA